MSAEILTLLGIGATAYLIGNNQKINKQFDDCIVNKVLAPIDGLLNTFYSNSGLIVDYVKDNSIIINTPQKELFGVRIVGDYNVPYFLTDDIVEKILNDYRKDEKGVFWYVLHKQGFYHRQYIFSYSQDLVEEIADFYSTSILTGNELANIVLDLYLKNFYWISDKKINRTIDIDFYTDSLESNFRTFNKIAKENIYTNINQTDLFQSYKPLEVKRTDMQKLLNLQFDGSIWNYFDLREKAVLNNIDIQIATARVGGNAQYFNDLKEEYIKKNIDLVLTNSTLHISNYSKRIIGTISSCLKNDYIRKDINRIETLRKTPFKYRDGEFDYLVPISHLKNYVASVHKRDPEKPDIWGYDKNGSYISYSFTEENDAPHFMIIGSIGTGKSFQKQLMISQIINLDFETMIANYDNSEIRSYDIGFSDELFVKQIAQKKENNVVILSSEYSDFSYNICNIDFSNDETIEADLTFQSDLINLILSAKKSKSLTIDEESLFKKTLLSIYHKKDFKNYTVENVDNIKLRYKLIEDGYSIDTNLMSLPSEYDFLKKPLLKDVINYCSIHSHNQQITEEERTNYKNLSLKLISINQLNIFSKFDEEDIREVKFLSMDLNNFKESDLFVPIFTCIFQKRYLRDRERAINCRRNQKRAPKVFYFVEECKNYFRNDYFLPMFEKIALEARKYNVHLGLLGQNPSHVPAEIAKNIDTKIFLLKKDKKAEVIKDIKEKYLPSDLVVEQLRKTDRYEMCVWYQKGAFNMKFEVTKQMFELFNTNTNLITEKENNDDDLEEENDDE